MRRNFLLILFVPFLCMSQEFTVPLGTRHNGIVFTLNNPLGRTIKEIVIYVHSQPSWISLEHKAIVIDSLRSGENHEIALMFDVGDGEAGIVGDMSILIWEYPERLIGQHRISLKTGLCMFNNNEVLACYPNPGNPGTTIMYIMEDGGKVCIEIFNILGKRVRTLVDGEKPAGKWSVMWDGTDSYENPVSSGMYIIRLHIDSGVRSIHKTQKILIEK